MSNPNDTPSNSSEHRTTCNRFKPSTRILENLSRTQNIQHEEPFLYLADVKHQPHHQASQRSVWATKSQERGTLTWHKQMDTTIHSLQKLAAHKPYLPTNMKSHALNGYDIHVNREHVHTTGQTRHLQVLSRFGSSRITPVIPPSTLRPPTEPQRSRPKPGSRVKRENELSIVCSQK